VYKIERAMMTPSIFWENLSEPNPRRQEVGKIFGRNNSSGNQLACK
jgi:hypothetical protein